MGRVYDAKECGTRRYRVETLGFAKWEPVSNITRIEFDDDADEGPAKLTQIVTDANGRPTLTPDGSALTTHSFRCCARIIEKPLSAPGNT